ncbi:MAG: hypothetical protein ACLFNN_02555 [Candidatus Paceibacterota bacterium]
MKSCSYYKLADTGWLREDTLNGFSKLSLGIPFSSSKTEESNREDRYPKEQKPSLEQTSQAKTVTPS